MSAKYAEYAIFAIIIGTYAALTYVSQLVPYKVPATTDKFLILDGNIDYLYDLVIRLDHMLEVIYFGFLIALLALGICYGQLQRRTVHLEQVFTALVQTVVVARVFENSDTAAEEHPAYGTIDEKRGDRAVTQDDLLRRIEYLEAQRAADVLRIATLERNVTYAQRSGQEEDAAVQLPYTDWSALRTPHSVL